MKVGRLRSATTLRLIRNRLSSRILSSSRTIGRRSVMYHFWLRIALLLYGLASLAVLPAVLYDRSEWRRIAVPAAAGGALFQFVALAEMLHAAHRWLPSAAHEVQSSIALLLAAV